jgi:hypothetical protein
MFIYTKRSGEKGRSRVLWGPLVFSIVASIVLTVVLNAVF